MKVLVLLALAVATCTTVSSETVNVPSSIIADHLIPFGEKIRKAEERMLNQRIVGGSPSIVGEFPYQAGTLTSYIGISGTGVCGGSLVSSNRVVSSAICWRDGVNQALRVTVVLGSTTLFTGGVRIDSSVVATHPSFNINLLRFDISVIYLPTSVTFSGTISPIALPAGDELNMDFAGSRAIVSGYGVTDDGSQINANTSQHHVAVTVITNSVCSLFYPFLIVDSHICTSGLGNVGICRGDSGSPLAVQLNGRPVLIGVTSFASAQGCEAGNPSGFSRVTSVMDFLRQNIN